MDLRGRLGRLALAAMVALSTGAALAPPAGARRARSVVIKRKVITVPETRGEKKAETVTLPQVGRVALNKVGIVEVRPRMEHASNVLVLEPGTSAAAAYFVPFAKALVEAVPGWQVWAVERRQNFLENQTELTKYKFGELSEEENPNTKTEETPPEEFFDYYLGYLGQDEKKAEQVAEAQLTKKVTAIVTVEAERALAAKVRAIGEQEVEAYVVEQVIPQAFEETGGVAPAFEERIAVLAGEYMAAHHAELELMVLTDSGRYAAEHGALLAEEGVELGEKLGLEYEVAHAAELAAEGKDIGEAVFNELVSKFKNHYEPVPDSLVPFAKQWGMSRAVQDLSLVIERAKGLGGKVVLGGHSLGGSVVTAYATWDFAGKPGAEGLSGLVYDDGGSSSLAMSRAQAEASLEKLDQPSETPWLAFGGIAAPDLGLFSATGATLTVVEPKGPSQLEGFPFLPPELKSPIVPVTNESGFGYSVNVGTSPLSLAAAQIHGGEGVQVLAEGDGLHGWDGTGALTPVQRYAEMLSGAGLREASGSEWYFPARLTLDTSAVGDGIANEAQAVLGLHSTMGADLPKSLRILAIDSELDKLFGGPGTTLTEAEELAAESGIPPSNLTLIEAQNTYAHNDPAGATPSINVFFEHMVPYLKGIAE